jgi:hypothetical protein
VINQTFMKCKVLTNLDHDGKSYLPGDVVELTEAQVKPLLPDVVELLEDMPSTSAPEPVSEDTEDELSYHELQEKAKELGVSAKGSKDELKERIAEAEAKAAASEETDEEETTGEEETDEDPGAHL